MWIEKKLKASAVVEMTYMMGVVMVMWVFILYGLFYYYDKLILSGAAYETAAVGSELIHEEEKIEELVLEKYLQERIRGKMIFMPYARANVIVKRDEIVVEAKAESKGLKLVVVRRMAVTTPEQKIRAIRTAKEMIEEMK